MDSISPEDFMYTGMRGVLNNAGNFLQQAWSQNSSMAETSLPTPLPSPIARSESSVSPAASSMSNSLQIRPARSRSSEEPVEDNMNYTQEVAGEARSRRRAQNRAAQRAFRSRKDKYVADLEQKTRSLTQEAQDMRKTIVKLEDEVDRLTAKDQHNTELLSQQKIQGAPLSSPHIILPNFEMTTDQYGQLGSNGDTKLGQSLCQVTEKHSEPMEDVWVDPTQNVPITRMWELWKQENSLVMTV